MDEKKYYWKMYGYYYEVTKEQYQLFKSEYDQQKDFEEAESEVVILSFDSLGEAGNSADNFIADLSIDVEEEVIRKITFERLWDALRTLSADEFYIINELFLKEKKERKTVRELAKILGISHTALRKRRDKIFAYLRKKLEN